MPFGLVAKERPAVRGVGVGRSSPRLLAPEARACQSTAACELHDSTPPRRRRADSRRAARRSGHRLRRDRREDGRRGRHRRVRAGQGWARSASGSAAEAQQDLDVRWPGPLHGADDRLRAEWCAARRRRLAADPRYDVLVANLEPGSSAASRTRRSASARALSGWADDGRGRGPARGRPDPIPDLEGTERALLDLVARRGEARSARAGRALARRVTSLDDAADVRLLRGPRRLGQIDAGKASAGAARGGRRSGPRHAGAWRDRAGEQIRELVLMVATSNRGQRRSCTRPPARSMSSRSSGPRSSEARRSSAIATSTPRSRTKGRARSRLQRVLDLNLAAVEGLLPDRTFLLLLDPAEVSARVGGA